MSETQNGLSSMSADKIKDICKERGASDKVTKLIEGLFELSHMEGLTLYSAWSAVMESVGISMSAPSFGSGEASKEEGAAKAEKTSFDVVIKITTGMDKLPAARLLQAELGVGLKEASDLLKEGTVLKKSMPVAEADELISKLAQCKVVAEKA
jgi:ribosomal protein L7/L12